MRERLSALLIASMLLVALDGCASNNGPQLPYPYGPPPAQPRAPAGAQAGVLPAPTAGVPASPAFPSLKRPSWGSPGTITQQREQATRFDPYGDNDAGPVIVGGRPREFAQPRAEPARSSSFRNRFNPFSY